MAAPHVTFGDLSGKAVLVTGGASGIGASLVEAFVAQGCKVCILDVDAASGHNLIGRLQTEHPSQISFFRTDLTDTDAAQKAVVAAAEAMGGLDVLINNAARDDRHNVDTLTSDDWDRSQSVNLKQMFFVSQAALPYMRRAGAGSIINFSSIAFLLNMSDLPVYATAKAGIIGLTKTLAGHVGPDNIRVNAVLPGMIVTERQKQMWLTDESIQAFVDKQCLKRSLTGADLVGPCLFLASSLSSAITAQSIIVDGGVI